MDGYSKGRNIMKLVRIEFRPYGNDREIIKNRVITKMESEGFVYKDEVALMLYSSMLVFDK